MCEPTDRSVEGVNEKFPPLSAVVVPRAVVLPFKKMLTVAPASVTPVIVGVKSFVGELPISDGVVTRTGIGSDQDVVFELALSLPCSSTARTK